MLLLLHIGIALASLVYTGYVYFSPSKNKLYGSYGLIAATLASGTALVIATHAPLLSVCMSGLFYLAVALTGVYAGHRKLASQNLSK